ncbi:CRISPR pre-crRNA endoribonuclease Cas5d [Methanimicrococcus sp. At1]|uniref:CRISPR pre-crRNA endoribonuclease Cas5d n=1 Tax=Methanimicrococcus hacksteinii TaxID=3028293 RepID=A0ABU3VQ60_9EURY|nr:type I-C CRISPR-associated protein Cas5c [Methanimicrococcus sp. At1]MDV0445548.1 CRISPR pre-crRNA endoribonuclease Cas5d [Methanimicrococcus sp. At1]
MEYFNKTFCLEVSGDFACFTRPEMKVERVSYDIMTPSAARAVFEAIFWKPAIKWNIKKIEILKPISWISVRRNEVGSVMTTNSKNNGIIIEDSRQQRAGLFLRDVKYRLYAELEFIPLQKRGKVHNPLPEYLIDAEEEVSTEQRKDENPGKYNAMFERRAKKGQCFNQPYLGCREFSCYFRLVEESELNSKDLEKPIDMNQDMGFMLYDMDFTNPDDPNPVFFRAKIENGILDIPEWDSPEVRK